MLSIKLKCILKLLLITVLLLGCSAQIVNAQNKIIFYVPFDGDIKPQTEMKLDNFKTQGEIRFTEGLEGKAIVVGNGWAEYFFPVAGIFNYPQGSVSIWVKPIDWDDESFIDFMMTFAGKYEKQMRLYRYRTHNNIGILAYFYGGSAAPRFLRIQVNKWKKKYGNWHNITWTWNENKATLYIDGILVDEKTDTKGINKEKIQKSQHLMIGSVSCSYPDGKQRVVTKKETAIDEVKIYNYTLGPEEIKKEFEKYKGKMEKNDDF